MKDHCPGYSFAFGLGGIINPPGRGPLVTTGTVFNISADSSSDVVLTKPFSTTDTTSSNKVFVLRAKAGNVIPRKIVPRINFSNLLDILGDDSVHSELTL